MIRSTKLSIPPIIAVVLCFCGFCAAAAESAGTAAVGDEEDETSAWEIDSVEDDDWAAAGRGEVLTVAEVGDSLELRARYLSEPLDVVALAGLDQDGDGTSASRYALISLRSPWFSLGRLIEPFLYRAAARSFTSAADLDRRVPGHPFRAEPALPAFSSANKVINRFVLHPFGDPLSLWYGTDGKDQEAGALLRLSSSEAFSVEAAGLAFFPAAAPELVDTWFPDQPSDPSGGILSLGMLLRKRSRNTTTVAALLASGAELSAPGAAALLQYRFADGGTLLRFRTAWATRDFRMLRAGLPAEQAVADCRVELGTESAAGLCLSGAWKLYHPPSEPSGYVPDRRAGQVALRVGGGGVRVTGEYRLRADRNDEGESEELERFGLKVRLWDPEHPFMVDARGNVYREKWQYHGSTLSIAARFALGPVVATLSPSVDLDRKGNAGYRIRAAVNASVDEVTLRLSGEAEVKEGRLRRLPGLVLSIRARTP